VRLGGHLDHRGSDRQPGARGEIALAEIEIDEQLIAREVPAALVLRQQCDHARVHQVQLHLGVRRAVGRALAAADLPAVADQAVGQIELPLLQDFALADLRPPDDHLQHATVCRRPADLRQPSFQFLGGQLLHGQHVISPARRDRA
jgi:hypothetical protein